MFLSWFSFCHSHKLGWERICCCPCLCGCLGKKRRHPIDCRTQQSAIYRAASYMNHASSDAKKPRLFLRRDVYATKTAQICSWASHPKNLLLYEYPLKLRDRSFAERSPTSWQSRLNPDDRLILSIVCTESPQKATRTICRQAHPIP